MIYQPRDCRACGGPLDTLLALGRLALSTFPAPGDPPTDAVPIDFALCRLCGLVQLRHTVEPDVLYRRQYWYRSGVNEVMQAELADVVTQALQQVTINPARDVVIDVGANDGTLLACYRDHATTRTIPRVAFEPADNLQPALAAHCEWLIPDYFGWTTLRAPRLDLAGRAKVITTIAMVYGSDDPHVFVSAVNSLLHPDGVWVVQFQDLWSMVRQTAFDNLCHEHLVYYSLRSFSELLRPHNLKVIDCEIRDINGGSLRCYVQHGHHREGARVRRQLDLEAGCDHWSTLERFAWQVGETRRQIRAALDALHDTGVTVDLYAASTKANTLLQYCGIDGALVRQAWERSPEKVGRTTATGIPIVSEGTGRADPPHTLLVGAWQFADAFAKREAAYLAAGGSLLLPLPRVTVVTQGSRGLEAAPMPVVP